MCIYLVVDTFAGDDRKITMGCAGVFILTRMRILAPFRQAGLLAGLSDNPRSFTTLICISFFLLYIILMAMWFAWAHEKRRTRQEAREARALLESLSKAEGDLIQSRCDALAASCGLTKRERDVVSLLARGRDTAFICEELGLARSTVKGYQKTAYAKLGVHSRQEIIDLFDGDAVKGRF